MPMFRAQRCDVYYLLLMCHVYVEIRRNFSTALIIVFFFEFYFIHSEAKTFYLRQGVLLQKYTRKIFPWLISIGLFMVFLRVGTHL